MNKTVIAIEIGEKFTRVVWSHSIDESGNHVWGESSFESIAPEFVKPSKIDHENSSLEELLEFHMNDEILSSDDPKVLSSFSEKIKAIKAAHKYRHLISVSLNIVMKNIGRTLDAIEILLVNLESICFTGGVHHLAYVASEPCKIPIPYELQMAGGPTSVTFEGINASPTNPIVNLMRYAVRDLDKKDRIFSKRNLLMLIHADHECFMIETSCGRKRNNDLNISLTTNQCDIRNKAITLLTDCLEKIKLKDLRLKRIFLTGSGASYYEKEISECLPGYKIELIENNAMNAVRGAWLLGFDEIAPPSKKPLLKI